MCEVRARWLALGFLAVALAIGATRTVGGYSTSEPDFYAAYAPQALRLLAWEPFTHTRSGPGYSLLLALGSFVVDDWFLLAKVIAALGVALIGYAAFRIGASLASARVGTWLQILLYLTLFRHALVAGNDVPCAAFACASLAFLVRHERPTVLDLASAGVLAGLATITRYPALALVLVAVPSLLAFMPGGVSWTSRARHAAVYVGGFLLASGPWWVLNTVWNGSPFATRTPALLALDAFGRAGTELSGWQLGRMEQHFTSWGDVLTHDPRRLAGHLLEDSYRDANQLFEDLITLPAYLWFGLGLAVLLREHSRSTRRLVSLLLYALLGFALVALAPYQSRYHIAILPVVALPVAAALAAMTRRELEPPYLRRAGRAAALVTLGVLAAGSAVATARYVRDQASEIPAAAGALARAARAGDRVVARAPHLAFLSGVELALPPEGFPGDRFLAWLEHDSGARFLYVGRREVEVLPYLAPLARAQGAPLAWTLIHQQLEPPTALYRVR